MLTETVDFAAPHPLEADFLRIGFVSSALVLSLDYPLPNTREPEVAESPEWYWVIIRDQRAPFSEQLRIEKYRPYQWLGDVGDGLQRGFGWVDESGNVISNAVASVMPLDDCQVVLCKKAS